MRVFLHAYRSSFLTAAVKGMSSGGYFLVDEITLN